MRVSSAEARMPPPEQSGAGEQFLSEIREQPCALARLLEHDADYAEVAAVAGKRGSKIVRMVGHGSSDNAASYGVYAFGLLPRWTALRDSITLTVHYDNRLDLAGSIVIGLSQSGQTPDVVEYVARAPDRAVRSRSPSRTTPSRSSPGRPRRSCRSRPAKNTRSRRRRPTSTRSQPSRCSPGTLQAEAPCSQTRSERPSTCWTPSSPSSRRRSRPWQRPSPS